MDELSLTLARWTTRRVMTATLVVLAIIGLAFVIVNFYSVFVVAFIAFVLSTAIRPLVQLLQRLKISPQLGVIIAYLLLLALLVGIVVLMAPLITEQLTAITAKIPDYYHDARQFLISSRSSVIRNLAARLPVDAPISLSGVAPSETEQQQTDVAVSQLVTVLENAGISLFVLIATLLLGFYWTLDGDRVQRTLLQLVAAEKRENWRSLIAEIQAKMGAFIRGQLILDLSIGALSTAAYLLIGIDYAIVLGILAGLLETIPILGPVLGAVPPLLITLAQGDTTAFIWVIVATVVIQQIEGTFLVPKVMDRAVGVNAVLTLVAFAAFSATLGLAGGILAVPLAAIVQIIFTRLVFNQAETSTNVTRRDRFGVLHYESQQLLQALQRHNRADETEDEANIVFDDQLEHVVVDLDGMLAAINSSEEVAA